MTIIKKTALAVGVSLALLSGTAHAQHPATDNQLFAGYCLGVTNARIALKSEILADMPERTSQQNNAWTQILERDKRRYSAYLLVDPSADWTGIMFAERNGEADFRMGINHLDDRLIAERIKRCDAPNSLPW